MNDPTSRLWPAFQRLANDHPNCNAVKLTLDLQRWFITVQQQHFLRRVADMVQPVTEVTG